MLKEEAGKKNQIKNDDSQIQRSRKNSLTISSTADRIRHTKFDSQKVILKEDTGKQLKNKVVQKNKAVQIQRVCLLVNNERLR